MAYNLELAKRIWAHLAGLPGVSEKKMFGGVGYLVNGNMACGVHGENLIVRLSAEEGEKTLALPYTRPFDLSGKPMRGWLYVEPAGWATQVDYLNIKGQQTPGGVCCPFFFLFTRKLKFNKF
jgi:hypothetical protein